MILFYLGVGDNNSRVSLDVDICLMYIYSWLYIHCEETLHIFRIVLAFAASNKAMVARSH